METVIEYFGPGTDGREAFYVEESCLNGVCCMRHIRQQELPKISISWLSSSNRQWDRCCGNNFCWGYNEVNYSSNRYIFGRVTSVSLDCYWSGSINIIDRYLKIYLPLEVCEKMCCCSFVFWVDQPFKWTTHHSYSAQTGPAPVRFRSTSKQII